MLKPSRLREVYYAALLHEVPRPHFTNMKTKTLTEMLDNLPQLPSF